MFRQMKTLVPFPPIRLRTKINRVCVCVGTDGTLNLYSTSEL